MGVPSTLAVLLVVAAAALAVPVARERRSLSHPSACQALCLAEGKEACTSCLVEGTNNINEVIRSRRDWEWNPDTKKYEWVEEVSVEKDKKKKKKKKATTTTTTKAKKDKKRRRKNKKKAATTTKKVKKVTTTTTESSKNKADVNDVEQLEQAFLAADYNPGCDTIRLEPGEYELEGLVLEASECLFIEAGTSKDAKAGTEVIVRQTSGRHIVFAGNGSLHITGITFEGAGWADLTNELGSGGIDFNTTQGSFTCIDCVFTENTINTTGGAINIANADEVTIDNSIFKENQAFEGGAVYIDTATIVHITNSEFKRNLAQDSVDSGIPHGGALSIQTAFGVSIVDSRFTYNMGDDGGAIYVDEADSVVIKGSYFSHNVAYDTSDGGVLYLEGQAFLSIHDTTFEYNAGDDGGVVYADEALDTELINVIARYNAATSDAIFYIEALDDSARVCTIKDVTFHDNLAESYSVVYTEYFLEVDASYVEAMDNVVEYGVLYIYLSSNADNGRATVTHSKFLRNVGDSSAGGGIYFDYGHILIEDVEFIENKGGSDGGAVYVSDSSSVTLNRVNAERNTAHSDGGFMYISSVNSLLLVQDTTMSYNKCGEDYDGGDIYVSFDTGGVGTMRFVRFTTYGAVSNYDGGSIDASGGDFAQFQHCKFEFAAATYEDGGALYLSGFLSVSIEDSVFDECEAYSEGGAVYITSATEIYILRSQFINNHADNDGGGSIHISTDCDNLFIEDCYFENGNSDDEGGFIEVEGYDNAQIINSKFINGANNDDEGGCVYLTANENAELLMSNLYFDHCFSGDDGGAVYADNSAGGVNANFEKIVVQNSRSESDGSAIYIEDAAGGVNVFKDCAFRKNTASESDGGALYIDGSDRTTIRRASFVENLSTLDDGPGASALYVSATDIVLSNSLFYQNRVNEQTSSQDYTGGAAMLVGDAEVFSNTFVDNLGGPYAASAIFVDGSGTFTSNLVCDNPGNQIAVNGDGTLVDGGFNIITQPSDPRYFTCTNGGTTRCNPDLDCKIGALEFAHSSDKGKLFVESLSILPDSPAVNKGQPCTATVDIRGVSRPQGPRCDVGSYELVFDTKKDDDKDKK